MPCSDFQLHVPLPSDVTLIEEKERKEGRISEHKQEARYILNANSKIFYHGHSLVLEYFITSCKFPTSTSWLTSMKLLDINVLLPCQTSELNAIERRKVMIDCSNWDTFHLFNSLFKPKDSHLRIEHTNMFWCSFYDDLTMRIVNSDIVFQLKCIFYLHFKSLIFFSKTVFKQTV